MHRGHVNGATNRSTARVDSLRSTRVRLHMPRRQQRQEIQVLEDQLPLNPEGPGDEEPSAAT
jgi:hypothetical protein